MDDLTPISGCSGCAGTAGKLGCPKHSPNAHIFTQPQPYAQLYLRCPWCGQDIQLDCFKIESLDSKKVI